MSASRDEFSQDSQHLEVSEQQDLSGSDDGGQYYADYVPEREFVLMPLFRRIGQLFGIGRHEESEYVYEPASEPQAAIQSRVAEPEPEASIQEQQAFFQEYGPFREHGPVAQSAPPIAGPEAASDDLLGIESQETVQPFAAERNPEPQSLQVQYEPAEAVQSHVDEPMRHAPVEPLATERAFDMPVEESRPETVPYPERPQLELVHSQSTAKQNTDLTAPLREAAEKISAAISQAAEWLHRKEEEILQGAELPQNSAVPNSDAQPLHAVDSQRRVEPVPDLPLEATLVASTPVVLPQVERQHFDVPIEADARNVEPPALQREVVWQGRRPEGASPELMQDHLADARPEFTAGERKPRLVPAPVRVPYWKRVDWAQEFTPKRVAVLGAVAMAVMMVLGVSLARRPASSMLPPQQQQARTHEPGGVTLTTRPTLAAAKASPHPARRASRSSNPVAAPVARQSNREPEYNDGPDVVTHYYNGKPKPSPSKQSTVAGVRHYSDM